MSEIAYDFLALEAFFLVDFGSVFRVFKKLQILLVTDLNLSGIIMYAKTNPTSTKNIIASILFPFVVNLVCEMHQSKS